MKRDLPASDVVGGRRPEVVLVWAMLPPLFLSCLVWFLVLWPFSIYPMFLVFALSGFLPGFSILFVLSVRCFVFSLVFVPSRLCVFCSQSYALLDSLCPMLLCYSSICLFVLSPSSLCATFSLAFIARECQAFVHRGGEGQQLGDVVHDWNGFGAFTAETVPKEEGDE